MNKRILLSLLFACYMLAGCRADQPFMHYGIPGVRFIREEHLQGKIVAVSDSTWLITGDTLLNKQYGNTRDHYTFTREGQVGSNGTAIADHAYTEADPTTEGHYNYGNWQWGADTIDIEACLNRNGMFSEDLYRAKDLDAGLKFGRIAYEDRGHTNKEYVTAVNGNQFLRSVYHYD